MLFRANVRLAVLALAVLVAAPVMAHGEDSIAACCPGYPAHLRAARAALVRGDQQAALTELKDAQSALASCLREEAAGRSLLARHVRSAHQG